MARQTPAEKEAAKQKKTARWNADRAYLRQNDDDFVAREKAATKKYAHIKQKALEFARSRAADFASFLRGEKTPVAPSSATPQPTHMLSPTPETSDQPFEFPVNEKPEVYGALGSRTPTAPY